ncbi:Methyltransferase type 11 [Candidatus Saccharibacteria bacterium RAAC3_TM7_1]|nr:Methyltransferase type 11 [Candidatus Saccharibacteria bacterium RAAC3_TM7_1]
MTTISAKRIVRGIAPHGVVVLYRKRKQTNALNYCPICEEESQFTPAMSAGVRTRPKAVCPNCGSLERHRLTWLLITREVGIHNINKEKTMLHVAPEPSLRQKFSELLGKGYLSADMYEKDVDVKMDITNIKYPNASFDFVMANHVLEHVSDDVKAMKELYRVQKKRGWSVLLVPIAKQATTYEDPTITSKKGRLEAFGQADHVRKYGYDYKDRLSSVGYKVKIYKLKDLATRAEIRKMSLKEVGEMSDFTQSEIYFCTK